MREVMEETGFDKFNRIDSKVYLEEDVYEKTRLFFILCVSKNKTFNDIPRRNSSHQMAASTRNSNKTEEMHFFNMVLPFIRFFFYY